MRIYDLLVLCLVISLVSISSVTDGQQNGLPNFINGQQPSGINPNQPANSLDPSDSTFSNVLNPFIPNFPIDGQLPTSPIVQYTGFPVVNYCYFYIYYQVFYYSQPISSGSIPPVYGNPTNYTVAIPVNYTISAMNVRFTATYYGAVYLPVQYIDRTNGVIIRFSQPMNSIYYIIACPPCQK